MSKIRIEHRPNSAKFYLYNESKRPLIIEKLTFLWVEKRFFGSDRIHVIACKSYPHGLTVNPFLYVAVDIGGNTISKTKHRKMCVDINLEDGKEIRKKTFYYRKNKYGFGLNYIWGV